MHTATHSRLAVLLFTDIVGSVSLKTKLGDAVAADLIGRHDDIFKHTIARFQQGRTLKDTGDGFLAMFDAVSDAVECALLFQRAIHLTSWGPDPIRVRIGIHFGEVAEMAAESATGLKKISGLAVDLAARIMSLADGGQILITRSAFDNGRQYVRDFPAFDGAAPPGVSLSTGEQPELKWMAHGPYLFRGSDEPVEVFEVGGVGLSPLKAPEDSEKARRAVKPGEEDVLGWRPAAGLEIPGRKGWVLDHRLGQGGFGEVWLGLHKKTRDPRAFKFCFDADRLRSFKRELTLFRVLREVLGERQDIAKLYEVSLERPPYVLESEYSPFGNMGDWAATKGGIAKIDQVTRIRLVARIARAVAAAHSVGVLHKDIKPSNILMHEIEGEYRPRLTDFGIGMLTDKSQLEKHNITITGMTEGLIEENASSRTGTRMYAPPELLSGAPFSVQGDVYALGVLLFQMAIGDFTRPMAQGWERDVPDAILRGDITECVQGDPTRRLQTASELADRLEKIDARRVAAAAEIRRRKFARLGMIGAAALAVIAVLGTTVGIREYGLRKQIEAQRDRAESNLDAVEDLAGAFMFEFNDEIRDKRGTLGARRLVLTKARDYLDLLKSQMGEGATALTQLADAHERVGSVELDLGEAAPEGATDRAATEFDAARTLREKAVQASRGDAAAKAALTNNAVLIARVQKTRGEIEKAEATLQEAVGAYDQILTTVSDAALKARIEADRAKVWYEQGVNTFRKAEAILGGGAGGADKIALVEPILDASTEQLTKARAYWSDRLAAEPAHEDAAEQIVILDDTITRQDGERLNKYRSNPEEFGKRLTPLREKMAGIIAASDALARAHPESAVLERGRWLARHNAGLVEMYENSRLGESADADSRRAGHERAATLFGEALAIATRLAAADESSLTAQRDLAICLNKVSNESFHLWKLNGREPARFCECLAIRRQSLELRRSILAEDAAPQRRRDVVVGMCKVIEVLSEGASANRAEPPMPLTCGIDSASAISEAVSLLGEANQQLQDMGPAATPALRAALDECATMIESAKSAGVSK